MRKLIFAAALAALLPAQWATAGDGKLNANQLRNLAPGAYHVAVNSAISVNVNVHLFSNGRMTGEAGTQHDSGNWHIVGNRLCIAWSKWLSGQTKCSSLQNQNGTLVGDGLTITHI